MPTSNEPQNQPPLPEAEIPEARLPEAKTEAKAETETEGEEAPFADFAHDPGVDAAAAEEEPVEAPEPIVYRDLNATELQAAVEAALFMHHKPVSIARLRELIHPEIIEDDYRTAVSNLQATYFDESRGIELVEVANGFQLRTKIDHKDILRRLYQIAPMKLTNAMLEVLAIVAYNQPSTREAIDRVRGVDSSHLVRVLLDKKMLRIVGKSDEIGRPMLYGTTKEFLELFGLRDLAALPSLREIEDMLPKNEVGAEVSEEELLSQEMGGIVENSKPLEFNDIEDLEFHETPQEPETNELPNPHGHRRQARHSRPENGDEAGGDLVLPPEIAGTRPLGPEGNA